MVRRLCKADQFGVPLHGRVPVAQPLAHDALVVVLAEDQDVWIGRRAAPGLAQRHARGVPAARPDVGAGGGRAKLERPPDDAELRVDLHGARLHGERPRLKRGAGVPVDEHRAHAAPGELVGEHQAGRAGTDDQDSGIHARPAYSALAPDSLTTFAHFARSLLI